MILLFSSHTAFALELIAIVLATFLLGWGMEKKLGFVRLIAVIVLILAILSLLHTLYVGYEMWSMMSAGPAPMPQAGQMAQSTMSAAS